METVTDFIFEGSKITADGDCSHEIKRHLLLGRKIMTNLDSILKSRDITLPTKVHLVKALVFPVVVYGRESWTIKKAESVRIDAFELWCWRRHLRVTWTARRSSQSILKEISPEYLLEGLMLKQNSNTWATWFEELTHLKRPWCWEWLRAGGEGDDRRWGGWIASPTEWTWVWVSSRSWWWTGKPGVLQSMGSERVEHDWTTKLSWSSNIFYVYQFTSVQSLSCERESVMPSSHLILCRPLLLLPQSLPVPGSFPVSQLFTWGDQSIGVSTSASVLLMNTQDWSPLGQTGWISLQSKGLSRVFSNTTVQKHQFLGAQPSSQSNSHIHT